MKHFLVGLFVPVLFFVHCFQVILYSYAFGISNVFQLYVYIISCYFFLFAALVILTRVNNFFVSFLCSLFITFICFLEFVSLVYRYSVNGLILNLGLIFHNFSEVFPTFVHSMLVPVSVVPFLFIVPIFYCVGLIVVSKRFRIFSNCSSKIVVTVAFLVLLICFLKFDTFRVFRNYYLITHSLISTTYHSFYLDSVSTYSTLLRKEQLVDNGRSLFFLHLESLNAELVNSRITPGMLRLAKDGVFFPKIQGASMQTIRAQEVLLCGTIPSQDYYLAKTPSLLDKAYCLPEILHSSGYKTIYFQNYPDFTFYDMDRFVRAVGFDEVHGADIMHREDPLLPWGYREDVYYRRVFEYLQKYKNQKIFVYLAVDSVNHFPFFDTRVVSQFPNYATRYPFVSPVSFSEKLANSTWLQDTLFADVFYPMYEKDLHSSSDLFVFGDHSWPSGIHKDNTHNQEHAFQENFVTSLLFLPASKSNLLVKPKTVDALHSQMGVLPTVLQLVYPKLATVDLYGSFFFEFLPADVQNPPPCLVSVQPYSDRQISIINYPYKYLFTVSKNERTVFNLAVDPMESNGVVESLKGRTGLLEPLVSCLDHWTR